MIRTTDKSRLASHSLNDFIRSYTDASKLRDGILGQLVIDYKTKYIYTTSLQYRSIVTGDSYRMLIDYPEYQEGDISTTVNYALVRYRYIDNVGYFTTEYPEISIEDITGSLVQSGANGSYIGATSDSKLVTYATLQFRVFDLGDVRFSNVENFYNSANDSFVLSSTYGTTTNLGENGEDKDFFINTYYYVWSLKPEMTKFSLLDDVDYRRASTASNSGEDLDLIDNWLYRTKTQDETNLSGLLNADSLSIRWDTSPKLYTSLDADNKAIYDLTYATTVFNVTTSVSTIVLDCDSYDVFVFRCNDTVGQINASISYAFEDSSTVTKLKQIVVYTEGLNGIINFLGGSLSAVLNYEQGNYPETELSTNIAKINCYTLLIYFENSGLRINLLHKKQNLINAYQSSYL